MAAGRSRAGRPRPSRETVSQVSPPRGCACGCPPPGLCAFQGIPGPSSFPCPHFPKSPREAPQGLRPEEPDYRMGAAKRNFSPQFYEPLPPLPLIVAASSVSVDSCFLGHPTIETAFPFQKHSYSGYWRWFGFCFGFCFFVFFFFICCQLMGDELDFFEGKKIKLPATQCLALGVLLQNTTSSHSGLVAQSHGTFFPPFFPIFSGFIIDHNDPTTSTPVSLSAKESGAFSPPPPR